MKTASQIERTEENAPSWVSLVRSQVKSLRFGIVQIVVHDSRVVQIERTERLRLDKSEPRTASVPGLGAEVVGEVDTRTKSRRIIQHDMTHGLNTFPGRIRDDGGPLSKG